MVKYKERHNFLRQQIWEVMKALREMKTKGPKMWPKVESFGVYMTLYGIIEQDNLKIHEERKK